MPGYRPVHPLAGYGPFNELLGVADTTQRYALGMVVDAVDSYFGYGRFVYVQYKGSSAYTAPGRLVMIKDQTFEVIDVPDTANTGYPAFVLRNTYPASDAATTYGWAQMEGVCPIQTANSIAAGTQAGIAAGTLATYAAGKGLTGCRVVKASTATITKTATLSLGPDIRRYYCSTEGLWVGLVASGTGVGSGAKIASIDPSGRFVMVDTDSTAAGTVTVTFTYTGFLLCHINSPSVAGAFS